MRGEHFFGQVVAPLFEPLEARLLLDGLSEAQAIELFNVSPALFVENQGQWADESVRYVHQGSGANVAMTDAGPVFQVFRRVPREGADEAAEANLADPLHDRFDPQTYDTEMLQFSAAFVGASTVSPVGLEPSETVFNYFVGDQAAWRSGVPTYEKVAYESLYDGIDLHVWGKRSHLKYEFCVEAGADWSAIEVRYDGVEGLALSEDGSLVVDLGEGWGQAVDDAPYIYQEVDGEQVEVAGRFVLLGDGSYGFDVTGDYDTTRELIVDPSLAWQVSFGSDGYDCSGAAGVAVDGEDNVYVVGGTGAAGWVSGGFDTTLGGETDAFVAKLSKQGNLLWSTYLGGSEKDSGKAIAVHSSGDVMVTGITYSSGWVSGGLDTTFGGEHDVFVVKLSGQGAHIWSTYLGGSGRDCGRGIALDAAGNALVTGETSSSGWTSGGFDTTHNGSMDGFVVKLGPSCNHIWSTYFGGSSQDRGFDITLDKAANVYVTGDTRSSGWVSGGYDTSYNTERPGSFYDAFAMKLSNQGAHLWSTYLGGPSDEFAYGIAAEETGGVYVTGFTGSGLYATDCWVSGGYDTDYGGGQYDGFVVKLSNQGAHLWSTYLGALDYQVEEDFGRDVAVDGAGDVYVTGGTESSHWVSGGFDTTKRGGLAPFVVKFNSIGAHVWSTYLDAPYGASGDGIATDAAGQIYVCGDSFAPECFVAKIRDLPTVVSANVEHATGRVGIEFSEPVVIDKDDLGVTDAAGQPVDLALAVFEYTPGGTTASLDFQGNLADGYYTITVSGAGVQNSIGQHLDGNGDGTAGGDYVYGFVLELNPPFLSAVGLNDRPGRGVSAIEPSGIGVRTVEIRFSESVLFAPEDVLLQTVAFPGGIEDVGETLTPLSVNGSGSDTMTITVGDPVGAVDTWVKVTLVADSITDTAGKALDGEPAADSSGLGYIYDADLDLPSGNGTPGGDAVFYVGSLRADMRGFGPDAEEPNGTVDSWDINGFTSKYIAGHLDADFRGFGPDNEEPNGTVDSWDINGFTSRYTQAIANGARLDDLPTAGGQGMAPGAPSPLPLHAAEPTLKAFPELAVLPAAKNSDRTINVADMLADDGAPEIVFVAGRALSACQPTVLAMMSEESVANEYDAATTSWSATDAPSTASDAPDVDVELPDLLALPALEVLSVP